MEGKRNGSFERTTNAEGPLLRILIHLSPSRNTQGDYSKCSQYLVDWNQVMTDFCKYILLLNQTELSGKEAWSEGPCTNGWEYDTENYHR